MSNQWSPERLDALNRLTTAARLLSTAIHETTNALQVISGNAEMLEGQPTDPDKVRARAQTIKTHADRAGTRLRGAGALAAEPAAARRRVDLRQIAERAADLRRYTLSRARIAVSIEGDSVLALADEPALTRVVANLVLNAERAVSGRPDAAIALRVGTEAGRSTLAVSDNGPGVPVAARARLFLPFEMNGESGCGLAVAKWLVERDGGTLVLADSTDPGATFVIGLPAA